MNSTQKKICEYFKIRFEPNRWIQIKCIYHNDRHPSAGIMFTKFQDKSGVFHCLGCKTSKSLEKVVSDLTGDNMLEIENIESIEEELDFEIEGLEKSQPINLVDLVERFQQDKGIDAQTIINLGGYVSNEGYLVFEYGLHKRKIGRYLGDDKNKPRFLNEKRDKGLFGEEIIRNYGDLFLVEGLTDYLSMIQIGLLNTVCSFGAELSEEQAYLLRGKTVFILYDPDYAGYKGGLQAAEQLKKFKGVPIIIEMGQFFQDDYVKSDINYQCHHNKEQFCEWLAKNISKYNKDDSEYIEDFLKQERLKFYKTDLSIINFTEGLYAITGLPGAGKTTMGISLIDHFVSQNGRTLYCNYDLPKNQIISRLASRKSKHNWADIEADHSILEPNVIDWLKLSLKDVKIMNHLTIDEIKHCQKYFDCYIIDYLQRIPSTETDSRLAIEKNLAILSDMAANEHKTVICISRMPASAFGKVDGHVFSGSAAIEYNAQAAIVLHKNSPETVCANIIKNTRGETGATFFSIDYEHQRIKETSLKQIAKHFFDKEALYD